MILQCIGNKGIRLGMLFGRAAELHPTNIIVLDHDPDVAQTATADLPTTRPPVQWRQEDLPQSANTKMKRLEPARLLAATGSLDEVPA